MVFFPRHLRASSARLALAVAVTGMLMACGSVDATSTQSLPTAAPPATPAATTTPSETTATESRVPTTSRREIPAPTSTPTSPLTSSSSGLPSTPRATPTPKPLVEPDLPTGIADPVLIEIPAIGVDARIVDLSLGHGDPEVPDAWEDAGWYTTTRNPGEIGPAVMAGHIDSKSGPAVFFRLDELATGDEVVVHGADGGTKSFTVDDSGRYPKTELPDEVFGFGGNVPELRLITCGGAFDRDAGHYRDNYVVYASQER